MNSRYVLFGLSSLVSQTYDRQSASTYNGTGVMLCIREPVLKLMEGIRNAGGSLAIVGDGDLKYTQWVVAEARLAKRFPGLLVAARFDAESLDVLSNCLQQSSKAPLLVDTAAFAHIENAVPCAAQAKVSALGLSKSSYICIGYAAPNSADDLDYQSRTFRQAVKRITAEIPQLVISPSTPSEITKHERSATISISPEN